MLAAHAPVAETALPDAPGPVAEVSGLTVSFARGHEFLDAVSDVSLTIPRGVTVGLVGESGCGKSTLAGALMGFLRDGAHRRSGVVTVAGTDIFSAEAATVRSLRGGTISLVPQNAGMSLTPNIRIAAQLAETVKLHRGLSNAAAGAEVDRLLRLVRLPDPQAIGKRYPYQLSGGQQQRVAIAMAVAGQPDLIVLDEATTGLDVVTQARILDLLDEIRLELNTSMLFVSHDLGVIAQMCDETYVMYAGQIVESGPTKQLFARPRHPYTKSLLAAVPHVTRRSMPIGLPGSPPPPGTKFEGCRFADRCGLVQDYCRTAPPELVEEQERSARCHRSDVVESFLSDAPVIGPPSPTGATRAPAIVTARDVVIDYAAHGWASTVWHKWRRRIPRPATLANIDLDVFSGETLAIVGESGSGKSTLAKVLAGLHNPTSGRLTFGASDLSVGAAHRTAALRQALQLVFQNPDTVLNPRQRVGHIIGRPLDQFKIGPRDLRATRVQELLGEVELDATYRIRRPAQLSGGQRQRVGIARALATNPTVLICDEVVSALDVSVQASVLRLLERLGSEHGMTTLFISHDLGVVRAIADRVAVLYLGRLVEIGDADAVFTKPAHPYVRLLLDSVPSEDSDTRSSTASTPHESGEVDTGPPARGCAFQTRCPKRIGSICAEEEPPWQVVGDKKIRCHLPAAEFATAEPPLSHHRLPVSTITKD